MSVSRRVILFSPIWVLLFLRVKRSEELVLVRGFDNIPTHRFKIMYWFKDCVGGYSLEGPLKGEYGEPLYTDLMEISDETI